MARRTEVLPANKAKAKDMMRVLSEVTAKCPVPFVRAKVSDPIIDVVSDLLEVDQSSS